MHWPAKLDFLIASKSLINIYKQTVVSILGTTKQGGLSFYGRARKWTSSRLSEAVELIDIDNENATTNLEK